MVTKILIPLDGSTSAERVLAHLRWLAPPDSTELVLVSVVEAMNYTFGPMTYSSPDLFDAVMFDAEKYLEYQSRYLRDAGYAVATRICGGDPAAEVLDLVQALQVDMIAMATHGRSGLARWALGSVAERLLQQVKIPIFLIRENADALVSVPTRIMVPLDGSDFSAQALPQATELASRIDAEMLLLNVLKEADGSGIHLRLESQEEMEAIKEQWHEEMGIYLEGVAAKLREKGIVAETRMALGDVAKTIDEIAVREEVGLIVMSTHGRSGFDRWVYGSVASKILRMVDCPLLLVRPTESTTSEARQRSQSA